jgi:glycosyltransferase involved in cell wall biosynthesis
VSGVKSKSITPRRVSGPAYTVVSRLLWPGTGRVAIEEARHLPAKLLVYRQSATPLFYDTTGIDLQYLRNRTGRGQFTSLYAALTMLYYSGRGIDATIDLDLIARAVSKVSGPALFHDQFAGLTGLLGRFRYQSDYAVYLHETALGPGPGVWATKSFWLNRALRSFDRSVLEQARLVLTNSELNCSILRESGIDAKVLYAGCNPLRQLPERREPLILATTVWDRDRNVDAYLELARNTRARVVLAGSWGRAEEMDAFREKYHDLVEVTGPISEAELNALSQRASVYVRFGFGERGPGQGGIQAMGFGLPVITNPALAISELITDGVDGFVVRSIEEAGERANSLLSDDGRRRRMSEAAWSKSQGLTWSAHADRLRLLMQAHFP